jgi:Sec-independent protein secretion pathway component TatC
MMSSAWLFFGGIALLYFFVMVPIQYLYISGIKERTRKSKLSQEQMYENMSFEEEQLHFHIQGNIANLPSTIVAHFLHQLRHRKSKG